MDVIGLKLSNNEKGISIIEVLVGFVLIGGIILGLNTFISKSYNGVRFLRADAAIKSYHGNLNQILGLEATCTESLSALNPINVGDSLAKITRNGNDIIPSFPLTGINTADLPITLVDITVASVQVTSPKISITLQAKYQFSNFQGTVDLVKMIALTGTSDSSGNISMCHSKYLANPNFAFVKLFDTDTKFGNLKIFKDVTLAHASSKILVDPPGGGVVVPPIGIFIPSDRNLKIGIRPIQSKLLNLNLVQPYRFNYIGATDQNIGLIAQDIQNVAPGLVEESNGKLGIKYSSLIPILWEQHKDILKKNESLKKRLEKVSKKLSAPPVSI